jgi:hypothetical protein
MNKYAPEYSKKERINFLLKHMLWVLPLYIVTDFWGVGGLHFIFYSLFVGMSLSLFIIILALEGPRSIKIMKYKYGAKAKIQPIGTVVIAISL